MNEQEKRQRILFGALGVLALILAWAYFPQIVELAEKGIGRERRDGARFTLNADDVIELRMADLEVEGQDYQPGRNIFRMGQKKLPPPPPPKFTPPPPRPQPTAAPPPPAPVSKRPPALDLQLLGVFGPERRRIAVLENREGEIFNALEQEEIEDKFLVHSIGHRWVDFKFTGFPDVAPERLQIGDE